MPSPSVTYSFSNATTADATQVNQNFTDVINGVSDGTKDLSISALTCAGTATFNGNVAIGNASSDTLTITSVLSGSFAMATAFASDFGTSTVGVKSLYLGSDDSTDHTVRLIAGTVGTSYTFKLPTSGGTAGQYLKTDGSGTTSWVNRQVVIGTAVTADANTTSGTYAVLSNPITVSITAAATAKYRIYANVPANGSNNGASYFLKVVQTTGSATINQNTVAYWIANGVSFTNMYSAEIIVSLVSGSSYVFELKGRVSAGTLTVNAATENTEGSTGVALIAEQIE